MILLCSWHFGCMILTISIQILLITCGLAKMLTSLCFSMLNSFYPQETREMGGETKSKSNGLSTMLWRAFQLAFRVYNFAGGQDDRADRLAKDLAREIETCPRF